jgi:hypothetical protein
MSSGDQMLRSYAIISSLRTNLPNEYEVDEGWVRQFNNALGKIEASLGKDLQEFKVPEDALCRSVASSNYLTGQVHYREGLWCRREVLLHKIDSVLTYFTGLQGGQDRQIGFRSS